MISTFPTKLNKLTLLVFFGLLACPWFAAAQESRSLSVSPTLFEMSANPSQSWSSNIRVINSNPYELQLYVDVVNFVPQGETGQAKFIPVVPEETQGQTIAEWFTFPQTEIVVPAEQTMEIPFTINVPENVQPGGHFAAIMVGTRPPETSPGRSVVETSQVVTSLVFLRAAGDIDEAGQIRSFRTTKAILEKPVATFELRFENTGNVHVQPQGQITIRNMWGQERGVIPVNREMLFGNVLPDSVRKFTFTWTGEWSLADMGRYTAEATLAYGAEGRQSASADLAFWVIPWKLLFIVLLFIFAFISFMTWAIKSYVRKMISLAGLAPGQAPGTRPYSTTYPTKKVSVVSPIEVGILDLRSRFTESEGWNERFSTVVTFIKNYKVFFAALVAVIAFTSVTIWYVRTASISERSYEVTIERPDGGITVTSEEIEYDSLSAEQSLSEPQAEQKEFPNIKLVNQSGVNGLAAQLRLHLESLGYTVTELSNDFGAAEENTVIVYAPEFASEALELSRDVNNALLSAFAEASGTETPITIYVGRDFENEVQ